MSSTRIACSCAVLVCGVIAGSWSSVNAFRLMQAPGVVQPVAPPQTSDRPGPLESTAKPITPENPIPRRTYSVLPQNPGGTGAPVAVTLRVTVNALGRIGESRVVAPFGAPPAVVKAAQDAVRQWVYDPPAEPPIAFNVTFAFPLGAQAQVVAYGPPVGAENGAGGFIGGAAPPLPPAPPPPPWVREGVTSTLAPVRVGGKIIPPQKVKDVRPVYPAVAQSSRVQGVIIMEVIIGVDGRADRIAVLRSIPLLDQAAMDAVKEWEFIPLVLNGMPVPVIMTVTVNFTLQ